MMQLEPNVQSPLLSASSSSGGDRGALSMLTDTEMMRFGEFLDGYPATAFLNRSSAASADEHSVDRFQRCRDRGEQQRQEREQESQEQLEQHDIFYHELGTARKGSSASSSSDASEAIDSNAAWPTSSAPIGEVTIAASYDAGYAHFAGECAHDAVPRDAPTYFEASCWPGDDCPAHLPIYADAAGIHAGYRRIPTDLLPTSEKDAAVYSPSPTTPSPAHMEHFMPFVHHGEPEMIFAGMELGGADFPSFAFNHPLHQVPPQHHQLPSDEPPHGHFFFPPGADDAAHFAPSMQALMLPLGVGVSDPRVPLLQFDASAFAGARGAAGGSWSGAAVDGCLAPTHFIKSDSRASPLAASPPVTVAADVDAAPRRHVFESTRARRSVGVSGASVAALETDAGGIPDFAVDLELVTLLNDCYWKNGRKNLQCFPVCPEHNDFYSMKMNNRKHSSVGVCRGPVYCHVVSDAAGAANAAAATDSNRSPLPLVLKRSADVLLPPPPPPQHMKYEFGVGASGSGGGARELFVLGRFERVPQRDECDLAGQLSTPPAFSSSAAFEQFRYSCFQAAELEDRRSPPDAAGRVRSTWCFLPDVWKVQPTLKKKRKATRSAPAQTFPFCFRVFVYVWDEGGGGGGGYACAAARASSFFELYSTRTVDRVKRKRSAKGNGASDDRSSLKRAATAASMKARR